MFSVIGGHTHLALPGDEIGSVVRKRVSAYRRKNTLKKNAHPLLKGAPDPVSAVMCVRVIVCGVRGIKPSREVQLHPTTTQRLPFDP